MSCLMSKPKWAVYGRLGNFVYFLLLRNVKLYRFGDWLSSSKQFDCLQQQNNVKFVDLLLPKSVRCGASDKADFWPCQHQRFAYGDNARSSSWLSDTNCYGYGVMSIYEEQSTLNSFSKNRKPYTWNPNTETNNASIFVSNWYVSQRTMPSCRSFGLTTVA